MKHVNQIPLATGLAILPVSVFAGEIRRRENNPAADSAGQLLAPVMVHRGTPAEKGDYNYQVRRDEQLTKMQNDRDNAAMLRGEQAQLPPELKEVSVRTCGWQIDFDNATLAVRRVEKGSPSTHPIRGDELRALRRLAREQDLKSRSCSRPSVVRRAPPRDLPPRWSARWRCGRLRVQGASAYATPRLRFRPANKGHDTRSLAGLFGPSEHPAHRARHRIVAGAL